MLYPTQVFKLVVIIAQGFCVNTHTVQQGHVQVVHWRFQRVAQVPSLMECPATTTRLNDWKIMVRVPIAIPNAGSIDSHHVVKKASFTFLD